VSGVTGSMSSLAVSSSSSRIGSWHSTGRTSGEELECNACGGSGSGFSSSASTTRDTFFESLFVEGTMTL
jgi:hypothetical protein